MKHRPNRRDFLALTGISATTAFAGCSSFNSQSQTDGDSQSQTDGDSQSQTDGDSQSQTDGDEGNSPDTEATLTAQLQPDQEELTSLQEELQAEVEDEEISQQEAQQELKRKQAELTEEAVRAYEETAADDDGISVEDSEPEYGILRITASAGTFVNALENEELAAILPSEYYDQFIQQQEQQQALQEQMEEQTGEENNTTTD